MSFVNSSKKKIFKSIKSNISGDVDCIHGIIEQHAENAAFHWLQRDSAVTAPHYDLADLAQLDDRVEANLDGLRIAGVNGWEICRAAMAIAEAGEIFTAGVIAFESLDPERMDTLLAAVELDPDLQRALISALGWIDFARIDDPAHKLLDADLPFLRFIGLSALAIHRRDPGYALARLIKDSDPAVCARAIKTVGELGRSDLLGILPEHFSDRHEKACFYAAWSSALLNPPSSVAVLQRIAEGPGCFAEKACTLALRLMQPNQGIQWLETLRRNPDKQRMAIVGMGALGDAFAIPFLLEQMRIPALARPAGEAFSMMTGVDLAFDNLEMDAPEGFVAGPTEDPADENVAMDPDEDLPWPDPDLIEPWWAANKPGYQAGTRYFLGHPITDEALQAALKTAYQRQRIAAAMELAIRHPGRPLFAWRAPGDRQKKILGVG